MAGVDLKSWEEHDWDVDRSFKFGINFGELDPGKRHLKFLAEAYKGFAPHGQFFEDEIEYDGAGVYFGF